MDLVHLTPHSCDVFETIANPPHDSLRLQFAKTKTILHRCLVFHSRKSKKKKKTNVSTSRTFWRPAIPLAPNIEYCDINTLLGQMLDDNVAAEPSSRVPGSEFDSPSEWDLDAEEKIAGGVSERPFDVCNNASRIVSLPFWTNPEYKIILV